MEGRQVRIISTSEVYRRAPWSGKGVVGQLSKEEREEIQKTKAGREDVLRSQASTTGAEEADSDDMEKEAAQTICVPFLLTIHILAIAMSSAPATSAAYNTKTVRCQKSTTETKERRNNSRR